MPACSRVWLNWLAMVLTLIMLLRVHPNRGRLRYVAVVGAHPSKLHAPGKSRLYDAAELGPIVLKESVALALLLWRSEKCVRRRDKRIYLSSLGNSSPPRQCGSAR